MTHLSTVEIVLVIPVILLAMIGFANGLYICAHGITIFDRNFSGLSNYRDESGSPFDRFGRMHKYTFSYVLGKKRPTLKLWMRAWIYTSFTTLVAYWSVVLVAILSHYFDFDPIAILSLGLSS